MSGVANQLTRVIAAPSARRTAWETRQVMDACPIPGTDDEVELVSVDALLAGSHPWRWALQRLPVIFIKTLKGLDVLVAHAQDRLLPAEQDGPAVFAFQVDIVEGFAYDLFFVAVHQAVTSHAGSSRRIASSGMGLTRNRRGARATDVTGSEARPRNALNRSSARREATSERWPNHVRSVECRRRRPGRRAG